jgi:hypothetical protein
MEDRLIYKSRINDVSKIWDSLGTFWADFEDKELIEKFWNIWLDIARDMQKDLYVLSLSKTISTCPAIIDTYHTYIPIYYSGVNQTFFSDGTYWYCTFTDYTPTYDSLPSGIYVIAYTGILGQPVQTSVTDSIDYYSLYNKLYLKNSGLFPEGDYVYITSFKQINPAIFDTFGATVGITYETFLNYLYIAQVSGYGDSLTSMTNASGTAEAHELIIANYLKHLIWATMYYRNAEPTIYNLTNGLGIVAGLPFSWYSGVIVSKNDEHMTIDFGSQFQYQYITYCRRSYFDLELGPPWKTSLVVGSGINQFEVLTSGINIYDFINSSGISEFTSTITESYKQGSKIYIEMANNILVNL